MTSPRINPIAEYKYDAQVPGYEEGRQTFKTPISTEQRKNTNALLLTSIYLPTYLHTYIHTYIAVYIPIQIQNIYIYVLMYVCNYLSYDICDHTCGYEEVHPQGSVSHALKGLLVKAHPNSELDRSAQHEQNDRIHVQPGDNLKGKEGLRYVCTVCMTDSSAYRSKCYV